MDLKAFFQRKSTAPAAGPDNPVQVARARARRRLVGASLLLVGAIALFWSLFETEPRPLALNLPIEVAPRTAPTDPVRPVTPAAKVDAPAAASVAAAADPVPDATVASAASAASAAVASVVTSQASRASQAGSASPAAAPVTLPVEPAPAAVAAAAPAPAPAPASAAGPRARFVVQVGAYSEAASAREARLKVERLGVKTYTQVVQLEGGKRTRVRVGPFETREEANQVLSRLKAAGLPGTVLTL